MYVLNTEIAPVAETSSGAPYGREHPVVEPIRVCEPSPVYSALAVVDDAVEPLSQSLSVARLFTLPVKDSTESQLEDGDREQRE